MDDFAVIGGGIGGACSALFLSRDYQTTLYEKEPYLGGCSSTFKHARGFYNTGATTFAGYQKGTYLHTLFQDNGVSFKTKKLSSSLTVLIDGKKIERYDDKEAFLEQINQVFYHPKNKAFYDLIVNIQQQFFALHDYYYSNASWWAKMRSLYSFKTLLKTFYPYLFTDAKTFIERFFGHIEPRYIDYMNNQVLIVAQAKLHEINFLTAALALAYQFMENHYVYGGMGAIFEGIEKVLPHVQKKTMIEKITPYKNHYILQSASQEFEAKNIVLNASLFEAHTLFDDAKIRRYLNTYQSLDAHMSAFVCYFEIKRTQELNHHYQIILPSPLPFTVSNSIFVSIGDEEDAKMSNSVTVSVHTHEKMWENENTLEQKMELEAIIERFICEHLGLEKSAIVKRFSGTPRTFKRYINRSSLGGIPMRFENMLFKLPSNDSPIKGLYHVGDTTFAAQGWPGVMMGVANLQRLLCNRSF